MDKKKIKKKIESLEKQKQKHVEKIKDYGGKNFALLDYWEKEIHGMEEEIEEAKSRLKK